MQHPSDLEPPSRRGPARFRPGPDGPPEEPGAEEPRPEFTWMDILAMTIAAYQVILPVVLLFIGAMALVYFLFRWLFL